MPKRKPWGQNKPSLGWQADPTIAANLGLVAAYLFNENGGDVAHDVTGNGNMGSFVGNATSGIMTWVPSPYGPAVSGFGNSSGNFSYVLLPQTLQATPAMSIAAWVKCTGTQGYPVILNKNYDGTNSPFSLTVANGSGFFDGASFYNGSWNFTGTSTSIIGDGLWHFVVGTYGPGGLKYYLDGKLDSTTSTAFVANSGTGLVLVGTYLAGSDSFNGQMASVAIANRVWTADEISRLYSEPFYWMQTPVLRSWKSSTAGILFDAASNSGYQSATSGATWAHTCTGSNLHLAVDISLLSVNDTVTSITYNGVALSPIGTGQNVSGGTGRIETWGLVTPATGTNNIIVVLSGSLAWAGTAVSRTGVHQTLPTESWNSNSGINVGAANATVTITPIADQTVVHAACATNDPAATGNQTVRNDVTGTAGSGIDEDSGTAVISPAAAQTMTVAVAALGMWAIAGYVVRPISASGISLVLNDLEHSPGFQPILCM